MNYEAREKAWVEWFSDPNHRDAPFTAFDAGWDAGRTFSAEDVERVARALWVENEELSPAGAWDEVRGAERQLYLDEAHSALAAIGTVEEAQ